MTLCQYRHIFGKEKEGIHSIRLFDIAVVDYIMTYIAAYFISRYYNVSFMYTSIMLFALAIVLHRIFCVNTTVNKMIFGEIY